MKSPYLDVRVHLVATTGRGNLNFFLPPSLTCSQIWLSPACGWSPKQILVRKIKSQGSLGTAKPLCRLGLLATAFFCNIIYLFIYSRRVLVLRSTQLLLLLFFFVFFRAKVQCKNARKTRNPNPKRIAELEIACTETRAEYESLVSISASFWFCFVPRSWFKKKKLLMNLRIFVQQPPDLFFLSVWDLVDVVELCFQ